jgi:mono/diheme cytochrome c family protein
MRRSKSLFATGLIISVALMSVMAAGAMQVRARDPEWIPPAQHKAKLNPLANRPEAESGGAKLFTQRCTTCHGDDGRGTTKGPDLTQPDVQAQTDGALFWKISSGNSRQGMPTFSFLPEAQRWQLVLRIRSLAFLQQRVSEADRGEAEVAETEGALRPGRTVNARVRRSRPWLGSGLVGSVRPVSRA